MAESTAERRRLGRYETLFRIASGGMAEVYAARALGEGGFQKLVALKRIRPELAEDARFVTMFLDEGRLAANINSPNVVSTIDLGRAEDNSLYLVMELVVGVSLATLMAETHVPIPMAVAIAAQAANGLHDAHEATSALGEPLKIVHRDCSPHNVLIDVNGVVKITDFGIAKAMERQTQSHAGEMKGKLSYLSPEQARGRPVDRRTDVFILGVDAWELFARRQLFEAQTAVEALHKVGAMAIPRLDEIDRDIPAPIADVIAQALARDPDERFATAAAFGNALLNALSERPPPRSEIGAFVRNKGGSSLNQLEEGIRSALGSKSSRPPPPPPAISDASPIPLANRRPPPEPSPPAPASSPPRAMIPRPARVPTLEGAALAGDTTPDLQAGLPPANSGPEPVLPLAPRKRKRNRTEPLPEPAAPARVRTAVLPLAEEDRRPPPPASSGGVRWWMVAPAILLALGGAAAGAWYFDRYGGIEPDPAPPPRAPVASPPPERREPPPPVAEPVVTQPPPPQVVEESPAPPERPIARPRPRPIARPHPEPRPDPGPGTIGDDPTVPRGDRAEAFDEIPLPNRAPH